MKKKVHKFLLVIVAFCNFQLCFCMENSYIAAVVDYAHIYGNYAKELLTLNVEQYLQIMRNASRDYADIIVFPESGLVDIEAMYTAIHQNKSYLEDYATLVPDPEFEAVPCEDKKAENFSMHLINISCGSRLHSIYTVVNLLEKAKDNETDNMEFYNTNVVFDRLGTVIAKYRKINLSEEPFLKPGTKMVTFATDFGVTFGIFTCFDILFKFPAIDVLSMPNVTDIIFPTAWYSQTPFLQALSIQHGYAKANGINFLGAGLQEPNKQDGGSGIFLADGTIAGSYLSGSKNNKIVIKEVPIIKERMPAGLCTNFSHEDDREKNWKMLLKRRIVKYAETQEVIDIDSFEIKRENMNGYVFEPLALGSRTVTRVCTEEHEFCCTFNITRNIWSNSEPDYSYMLVVYNGVSQYASNLMAGIRTCALLACTNESDYQTCGYKINSTLNSFKFESIEITTIVDKTNDTYYQPSTLTQTLQPVSDYNYCEIAIEDEYTNKTQTKIIISTTTLQDALLTFGIYGRMYDKDTLVTPAPPPEIKPLNYTLIMMVISFSVIILICSAGLMYKFCMKQD